jgi:hypothetical protein
MSLPFDVLLTTYDIALMDQDFLSQIPWQYAVIDEAQRLKNPSSVRWTYLEISLIYSSIVGLLVDDELILCGYSSDYELHHNHNVDMFIESLISSKNPVFSRLSSFH